MVTVINTPAAAGQSSSAGWIVAGVLVIAATLVALFVWPGYARQTAEPTTVQVNLPALNDTNTNGSAQ
ncbi:MAG: hypothetical protein KA104_02325 [Candidatus Pacebacteria bacterium]|nr:hypothetical protein [Candidatus Paceibacterota bacterium]